MQFETLVNCLVEQFKLHRKYIYRLKLRLACRTGIWIEDLYTNLEELWSKEDFAVYYLAPLSKQDVFHALEVNEIETSSFLEEAHRKGITSFLIKPVTLNFILDGYNNGERRLPESQIEIYEQGCRLYCSEVNRERERKRSIADRSTEED